MPYSLRFLHAAVFIPPVLYLRYRSQAWFLLTCFYGSFALGLTYWLLFIIFYSEIPELSPISDLSWLSGLLFMMVLQNVLRVPGEGSYRPFGAWVAPVFSAAMCLYFFRWGDYLLNILWAVMMGTCGYNAVRGFLWARISGAGTSGRKYFHMAVLGFFVAEYCLWISSCNWKGESLSNPYFGFDFLLTLSFFAFVPHSHSPLNRHAVFGQAQPAFIHIFHFRNADVPPVSLYQYISCSLRIQVMGCKMYRVLDHAIDEIKRDKNSARIRRCERSYAWG